MQDRLLNAFLATSIDQATFDAKSAELRDEIARVRESEAALAKLDPKCAIRAGGLRSEPKRGPNLARFKQRRSSRNLGRDLFEPRCLGRNSSQDKERALRHSCRRALFEEKSGRQDAIRTVEFQRNSMAGALVACCHCHEVANDARRQ